MLFSTVVWVSSLVALAYVYGGFAALLIGIATVTKRADSRDLEPIGETRRRSPIPFLTVIVPAFNEQNEIRARLENLIDTEYPCDRLEILVVSDGSTDRTVERTEAFASEHRHLRVRCYAFTENRGRAAAQNLGVARASGDVVVATDVATRFTPTTLPALARPFRDPTVGVVGGIVQYLEDAHDEGLAKPYGAYRHMERRLRRAESMLGLLCKTDGPCTAFRRTIWRSLEPFEDVDQVIVLLARQHGLRGVQVEDATCTDVSNARAEQEVRQRARMTRKALLSTLHRWRLEDVLREPVFTWVLVSHKLARFASPLLVFLFLASSIVLTMEWAGVAVALTVAAIVLVTTSWLMLDGRASDVGLGSARAFCLAQLGFARGLAGWLRRDLEGRYAPTRTVRDR